MIKRKRYKKRTKYRIITFKLSSRQYNSMINYCNARQTTPVKLIKKHIRPFINGYDKNVPDELYVTENQLDMFSEDKG